MNNNIIDKEKLLLEKLIKLILKLEIKENYYEIFNLFFITENILDKNKFNNILNKVNNKTKLYILNKLIAVNNINQFNNNNDLLIQMERIKFNHKLNKFITKIEFLN